VDKTCSACSLCETYCSKMPVPKIGQAHSLFLSNRITFHFVYIAP